MVERLETCGDSNNAVGLESDCVSKAMSKSEVARYQNEKKVEELDSEGESTQAESAEENGDDDHTAADISLAPRSKSVAKSAHSTSKTGGNVPRAKAGENGRIVQTGTSSESSIKTTPDSSLDTHPSNYESSNDDKKKRHEKHGSTPHTSSESRSNSTKQAAPSPKTATLASTASIDKGPLNIRALPFESGVNTECIQLLRQLWNVHDEALQFLNSVHHALCTFRRWLRIEDNEYESSFWDKSRLSGGAHAGSRRSVPGRSSGGGNEPFDVGGVLGSSCGNDVRWIPLQPFIDGLKCNSDNVSDIEKQCLALSVFQSQCKLVLFAKVNQLVQFALIFL